MRRHRKIHAAVAFALLATISAAASPVPAFAEAPRTEISVVTSAAASPLEKTVAIELAEWLRRLYPADRFATASRLPADGDAIALGTIADPWVRRLAAPAAPTDPESYVVAVATDRARRIGVIAGADPRGAAYGVYRLLETLGCGFFLCGDTAPPPCAARFSFAGWSLKDRPLVRERIVFDWHNFLSGCSTWNLPDWQRWTDQAQKMGYNAIMVHAYGNNPMVSFTYDGKTKPVGYLSTTVRGRDWSTMHVNDVRRLWGGSVFDASVFGADAALGPDETRAAAAQRLMHDVFDHAAGRGMDVFFATDVDTVSANPQQLIRALPEHARFAIQTQVVAWMGQEAGRMWLADPDTPEGYRYYQAQAEALLAAYPQITCLVLWFRRGGTPWMEFKLREMPPRWQEEYRAELAKTPDAAELWHAHNLFALGKVLRAWERALQAAGHGRVQLATGTWDFEFLAPCDRFLPPHVKLIGLDYAVLHDRSQLSAAEARQALRRIGERRSVIPVIWAQHDDGAYVGRPYTPDTDFFAKLADAHASGFGIIHWTTRPLDLFFTSHVRQVWQSTKNEPLSTTCTEAAARLFGPAAQGPMGEYLRHWLSDAPKFGRETTDWFIDRPLGDVDAVVARCARRRQTLDSVVVDELSDEARDRLDYFRGLETFIADFYRTHARFQQSQQRLQAGDLPGAQAEMAACDPASVIEQFARFSSLGGITRGEQGLVVSLNTRWLSHVIRHRQALGMEPVRLNFAPTSHDPLAQSPGKFTFHFDAERAVWQCLGTHEVGADVLTLPVETEPGGAADAPAAWTEICRTGVESDRPILWRMQPIMAQDSRGLSGPASLPAGKYRLRLLLIDPSSTAAGQRVFDVSVACGSSWEEYAFDSAPAAILRVVCQGNSENDWNSLVEVRLDAALAGDAASAVSASDALDGYPAQAVVDGDPQTRWAARGEGQWLQFRLDSAAQPARIGFQWYAGDKRQARFEVQTSPDGISWNAVKNLRRAVEARHATERVDIFQLAGKRNQIVVRDYDLDLGSGGSVDVRLAPIQGPAIVCGAVLEPVQ